MSDELQFVDDEVKRDVESLGANLNDKLKFVGQTEKLGLVSRRQAKA